MSISGIKLSDEPSLEGESIDVPNKTDIAKTETDRASGSIVNSVSSKQHSLVVNEIEVEEEEEDEISMIPVNTRHVRRIIAEDPFYNLATVSELELRSLSRIVDNFTFNTNMYNQMKPSHKRRLLDDLSTDIPLRVVTNLIEDGIYWKRKSEIRWPLCEVNHYGGSWKRLFHERNLEEIIESFVPEKTDRTLLEDTLTLSCPFVERLIVTQLLPPVKVIIVPVIKDDSSDADSISLIDDKPKFDHIDLGPVLSKLTNLTELKLKFDVKDVGMNFEWETFQFTIKDCLQLAKCVAATTQLRVFHLNRSRVDCDRCRVLIKHILPHPNLLELDLSHNHIGDRGAVAIAKMIHNTFQLDCLRVTNNMITNVGAHAFAFALLKNISLRVLDMRLNRILDDGGQAILKSLLVNETLEEINLAGNEMADETAMVLSDVVRKNFNIIAIDVSNNRFGLEGGKQIRDGLLDNRKLLKLDMRFTECDDDVMFTISQMISYNQKLKMYENEIDSEIQRHSTTLMIELHKTIFGVVEEKSQSTNLSSMKGSLRSSKGMGLFKTDIDETSSAANL